MGDQPHDWDHARILASAEIVLFCRDDCAYCERAKELARRECPETYRVIDVSYHLRENTPGFEAYYEEVRASTRARTVPIVFYRSEYVGGFDQLRDRLLFSLTDF